MAKLGAVIDDWNEQSQVQISALQCWTSLEEILAWFPCTVMSMMSDSLTQARGGRCFGGVLGMHRVAARFAIAKRSAWTGTTTRKRSQQGSLFPLRNLPKHFFKEVVMVFRHHRGTVGRKHLWHLRRRVKSGAMSFARFSTTI